jgi:hypothetical protein
MKQVNIINNKSNQLYGAKFDDPTSWIADCIAHNYWGKSERWVQSKYDVTLPDNQIVPVYPDEVYNDLDVLETQDRVENNVTTSWVKLKAQYTIEIIELDTVDSRKIILEQKINTIAQSKILAGFSSSALGEPYFYSSDVEAQLNILGNVQKNESVKHRCTKISTGVKDRYLHTVIQMKQVFDDGYLIKTGVLQKATDFKNTLTTLTTFADIDSLTSLVEGNWGI